MIKKLMCIISILIISLSLFIPMPQIDAATSSKAKTLAELRKELADYKAKQATNNANKKATQNQISNAKYNVSNKQNEISQNQQKIQDATIESQNLEQEIENGKKELSELVKNYQIASGDNLYLQYIFESSSYEELIYRYAVIEQIMNYQEGKISEWKDKIEYNNQLKVDLAAREVELNQQISDLADKISDLNDELEDYFDISLSVEDDIKSTEELIKYYQNLGCKENQDLQECVNILGDTGFIRPLVKGTITSVWGNRKHPVTGKVNSFHNGVDIGGNKVGTSVYSAANGMVGKIIKKASCGGNQVYIYHTINGKRYTTVYMHLNTINVILGQKVTSQTVIGTVGGQKGTYDTCTTGAHLHFGMGTGWYGSDYTSSSKWKANSVNPATKVSFPAKGKYFYTRV